MPVLTSADIKRTSFTVTANSTSAVTVAYPNIERGSVVIFTMHTAAGTPVSQPYIDTFTPGTGFTFKAGSGDTSIYTCTVFA